MSNTNANSASEPNCNAFHAAQGTHFGVWYRAEVRQILNLGMAKPLPTPTSSIAAASLSNTEGGVLSSMPQEHFAWLKKKMHSVDLRSETMLNDYQKEHSLSLDQVLFDFTTFAIQQFDSDSGSTFAFQLFCFTVEQTQFVKIYEKFSWEGLPLPHYLAGRGYSAFLNYLLANVKTLDLWAALDNQGKTPLYLAVKKALNNKLVQQISLSTVYQEIAVWLIEKIKWQNPADASKKLSEELFFLMVDFSASDWTSSLPVFVQVLFKQKIRYDTLLMIYGLYTSRYLLAAKRILEVNKKQEEFQAALDKMKAMLGKIKQAYALFEPCPNYFQELSYHALLELWKLHSLDNKEKIVDTTVYLFEQLGFDLNSVLMYYVILHSSDGEGKLAVKYFFYRLSLNDDAAGEDADLNPSFQPNPNEKDLVKLIYARITQGMSAKGGLAGVRENVKKVKTLNSANICLSEAQLDMLDFLAD